MKIQDTIKEKIDECATRLSDLDVHNFSFEIVGCLNNFRDDLFDRGIMVNKIEESDLTHEKQEMNLKSYLDYGRDIALFASGYFGTEHVYVTNKKTYDGIILIGQPNHIYATRLVFECLTNIAASLQKKYLRKRRGYKNKGLEGSDYQMSYCLETLTKNMCYRTWYDAPEHKLLSEYSKTHFKTSEDQRKLMMHAIQIIEPIYDMNIPSENIRKTVFEKFSEEDIYKTREQIEEFQTQDVVMVFLEDDDDDDE